ncbi:CGNR zinc finger domain-containing protein [soil metagenome]
MSTGQWITSSDGTRWFFEAGAESLDFAYTGDWGMNNPSWERLRSTADLGHWLGERFERIDSNEVTERDLMDAVGLRQAIARLATAVADHLPTSADDVDTLNLFAATPDVPPALAGGHRQAGAGRVRIGQALSTLARDAVEILGESGDERLRRCHAQDCRMVFHDESRTNNRRWCSMQRCGNRAKVRAHRERISTQG